ncbi:murein hydrolase activator EnvC [Bacillus sp. 03113]|uniref:murein hydrolase activator EnvC family protein n=1 Tax=Bacillus sp. 03113 TaxID=2578211 RepID=UPI0011447A2F|nr:peptidoglycan DD-metalloendopeptidase family protein [Bacillus sp. 03113]
MKKSLLTLSFTAVVGIGSFFTGINNHTVSAANLQDLQSKKDEIQQNRSGVESGISQAEQEINRLKTEQEKVNSEIKRLDMTISDTNEKIRNKNTEITETQKEIEKLNTEIAVLQERIQKRDEMLKERARAFQETGGSVNYLDVLLGSQSFGDFVDRVGAVATIIEADKDLIRQHLEDKNLLETKQVEVEKELTNLQQMLSDLETIKMQLDSQKAEKDKLMETLKSEVANIESEKLNLEEEKAVLTAQEAAIQKAVDLEQKRQAESGSSSSMNESVSTPAVSSGVWTKPAEGRLTSKLGQRWNKFHAGIDIANSADVPIVAAADGVVIRSDYSSSYGNVIYISHSISGQTFTTVYAHMDSRKVGSGDTVSKGQQIGIMGNTGQSFGQHLHFELHKGSWNASKSNAINPLDYIPM